jgi:hypothetical protein
MRIHGTRLALAAVAAVAATMAFTAPAGATVYEQEIHLSEQAHIADGMITLSGAYTCNGPGHLQIGATVLQDGTQLTLGAGEAVCDGTEHLWEASGSLELVPDIHPGAAEGVARLNEVHFSGLMPRAIDTVAEDHQDLQIFEHKR